MKRDAWKSRFGFVIAAAGSAVGLGNIWRFPYLAGEHGGALFILVYLLCVCLIGFPVIISEITIGRAAQTSAYGAFKKLGRHRVWGWFGSLAIFTGFMISTFYSVIGGWLLGYLIEAVQGTLTQVESTEMSRQLFDRFVSDSWWVSGCHLLFVALSGLILFTGVRKGIERGNKVLMPILFLLLLTLVVRGLMFPTVKETLSFLFAPQGALLGASTLLIALGQSFFSLSLGQGTMVTYGSYLSQEKQIPRTVVPIVGIDTLVSILSGIAVFGFVFAAGFPASEGPGLLFRILPVVFGSLPGAYLFSVLFFLLVLLAALTSQISAMEPFITYLVDVKGWTRRRAALTCTAGVFLLGIPSALSNPVCARWKFFGYSFFDCVAGLSLNILVPLNALAAVLLVGWVWGWRQAAPYCHMEASATFFDRSVRRYLSFAIRYLAPILIVLVFLNTVL